MCSSQQNRQQECKNNLQRVASNQAKKGNDHNPLSDTRVLILEHVVCADCKGPLDRALFTHPDRQGAVKNCTIFPL